MAAGGPGQPVRRARLEVFRISSGLPTPVWTSDFAEVGYRGATRSAAAIGPGWPPTFANIDTEAWAPGCYYADIVEQDDGDPGREAPGLLGSSQTPGASGCRPASSGD